MDSGEARLLALINDVKRGQAVEVGDGRFHKTRNRDWREVSLALTKCETIL